MRKQTEPVLVTMSVLAGLQYFFATLAGAGILMDLNPVVPIIAAGGMLLTASVQMGVQFYVRGQVTPTADVVESVTGDGTVVAGPASEIPAGTPIRQLGSLYQPERLTPDDHLASQGTIVDTRDAQGI